MACPNLTSLDREVVSWSLADVRNDESIPLQRPLPRHTTAAEFWQPHVAASRERARIEILRALEEAENDIVSHQFQLLPTDDVHVFHEDNAVAVVGEVMAGPVYDAGFFPHSNVVLVPAPGTDLSSVVFCDVVCCDVVCCDVACCLLFAPVVQTSCLAFFGSNNGSWTRFMKWTKPGGR
jgi:hypothetical protein